MMISSKIKSYVSVVTATYNRAHLLSRSFNSLVEGELHPLEWIIIDDGSTDNTEEVVSEFVKESPFPIVYRKKENGGVHTAVNVAFGLLEGDLFVKLDSDDWLCSDAIKRIQDDWDALSEEEKKKFAGLCYLCSHEDGKIIGDLFKCDIIDGTHTKIRVNKRIKGDKCEAIRSDLVYYGMYKEFPGEYSIPYDAPLFPKFSRDGLMFRHFNSVIKVMEYQDDGITMTVRGRNRRAMSPRGFAEVDRGVLVDRDLNFKTKGKIFLKSILSKSRKHVGFRTYSISICQIFIDVMIFLKNSLSGRVDKNFEVR
jgi:glycosyltransferase involved in cell wall biosynthesis